MKKRKKKKKNSKQFNRQFKKTFFTKKSAIIIVCTVTVSYTHLDVYKRQGDRLCDDTSLDTEDSYLKNYKKAGKKTYKSVPAVHMTVSYTHLYCITSSILCICHVWI